MVKEKNARKHRPKHLCLEYSICFATGEPGPAHPDVASLLKYQKRLARHAGAPLPPHGHSPNKPSPPGLVVVVVVARAEGRVLALCPKLVNVEVPPFGGLDELLRHKVLLVVGDVVSSIHLGINLDVRIGRYKLVGDGHPLHHLDAACHNGIVLHVTHRNQLVDLGDAEPVEGVWHQLLKPHVLHTRHARGAVKVGLRAVPPLLPLAGVVDEKLGHLPERAPLLAEVDNDSHAPRLRRSDAFLDAVGEVGAARADVGPKDV
mmetsp:Transcript_35767/g.90178  ORF Transcript_35767/g.90178 Transcript_35767/m.90178 type:complete len:261 (-) Transcript_35767:1077-1859(-)